MWYNLCARFLGISNVTYIFIFFKVIVVFSQNKYSLYVHFMYMISQVILLAFMCFLNFWDRPIFKEVMNNYVMQSQSFCEDTYVTPKGVWSWDWRDSKVHVAHMGPTWVLSTPGVPHVGPMNLAIRVSQDCIARVIMSQQIDMAPTRQDESYQHLEDCMLKHVCANVAILYPQVWLCVEISLFFVMKM